MLCAAHCFQALMDKGLVNEQQIQEMLAQNEGKFKGSLLEEMLNQLIERLVEEGYLTLHEEQPQPSEQQQRQCRDQVKFPSHCRATFALK